MDMIEIIITESVNKLKAMVELLNGNDNAKKSYEQSVEILKNSPYTWEYKNTLEFGKENGF